MTIVPAYGRDYRTAKAAVADFESGKDFLICDHFSRYDGKPVNKEQLERGTSVTIRFDNLRKVTNVKVKGN